MANSPNATILQTILLIDADGNKFYLDIFERPLKAGGSMYIINTDDQRLNGIPFYQLASAIEQIRFIGTATYRRSKDQIEIFFDSNTNFDKTISEISKKIQNEIDAVTASKKPKISVSTPNNTSATTSNSPLSNFSDANKFVMGMIKTSTIIELCSFERTMKDRLITIFIEDGYKYFYELPYNDDIIKIIENKIQSVNFSSARAIVYKLKEYFESIKDDNSVLSKIIVEFNVDTRAIFKPVLALNVEFINSKDPVKKDALVIVGIHKKGQKEEDYIYDAIFEGNKITIPRNKFIINGDLFSVGDKSDSYQLISILPNRNCRLVYFSAKDYFFSVRDFDVLTILNFNIYDYNQLHEYFEKNNLESNVVSVPKVEKVSKSLGLYEANVEKLNKEISELIILKNLTPKFKIENILNIQSKVAKKQKEVNDLAVVIADKKLENNKIFDELFEQSFLPLQKRYDDIILIDTPNNNGNFFTPNGQPSKLSDELNLFIRTPLFTNWFGDWQLAYQYKDIPNSGIYCSKVLTSDFEPKIVWHGTSAEFSYFKFDNFPASYYAVNRNYCDFFATIRSNDDDGGYIIPFFLNLRNPLNLTKFGTRNILAKDFFDYIFLLTGMSMEFLEVNPMFFDPQLEPLQTWMFLRNNPKMLKKLSESNVFDGIHFYENNPNVPVGELGHMTEAYITFKPESSKIADPNRGNIIFASMKSFLLKKGGKI